VSTAIRRFDCADPAQRAEGIEAAAAAVSRGELIVLPTDTVYGIGADAFMPAAVTAMLAAKGRGRQMPSPVLVGSVRAAAALIDDLGMHGQDLIDEFWPGALTLVCPASRTLSWDLGETKGTVAVRMPLHPVTLELLKQTGPMAVSSANKSGQAPALTVAEAAAQLGDLVAVYLDGGPAAGGVPSSIVDLTGTVPRLLRAGAISAERLRTVAPIVESTEPSSDTAASSDADTAVSAGTGHDSAAAPADTGGSGGSPPRAGRAAQARDDAPQAAGAPASGSDTVPGDTVPGSDTVPGDTVPGSDTASGGPPGSGGDDPAPPADGVSSHAK